MKTPSFFTSTWNLVGSMMGGLHRPPVRHHVSGSWQVMEGHQSHGHMIGRSRSLCNPIELGRHTPSSDREHYCRGKRCVNRLCGRSIDLPCAVIDWLALLRLAQV